MLPPQVLKQGTGGALSTAKSILSQEGATGFWRGNALNVLRTAPFKVRVLCVCVLHCLLSLVCFARVLSVQVWHPCLEVVAVLCARAFPLHNKHCTQAVNFFCFDTYHRALVVLNGKDGNSERFASGAMAGEGSVV